MEAKKDKQVSLNKKQMLVGRYFKEHNLDYTNPEVVNQHKDVIEAIVRDGKLPQE